MGFARNGRILMHGLEAEPSQEEPRFVGGGAPHNNWIELTARGRHARCLRTGHAGSSPGLLLRRRPCAPCSQLIQALYGRGVGPQLDATVASAWTGHGPWSGYGIHVGRCSSSCRNEFLRKGLGARSLNGHGLFVGHITQLSRLLYGRGTVRTLTPKKEDVA